MSGAIGNPLTLVFELIYVAWFVVPILLGFFAERIFKSRAYGRWADVAIALIGGVAAFFACALVMKYIENRVVEDYYRRGLQYPLSEKGAYLIYAVFAVAGALVLLYAARRYAGGRGVAQAPATPAVAATGSSSGSPSDDWVDFTTSSASMASTQAQTPQPARAVEKAPSSEVIESLKKLGDLHAAGVLTAEEFESKKAELLKLL